MRYGHIVEEPNSIGCCVLKDVEEPRRIERKAASWAVHCEPDFQFDLCKVERLLDPVQRVVEAWERDDKIAPLLWRQRDDCASYERPCCFPQ